MIHIGISSIKDLKQDVNGDLSWGANVLTTNSQLTTELATKQDTLTAGSNITISNNTIASTGGLIIEAGGVVQSCTTLNFGSHLTFLSNNVLTLSRLTQYDKLPLRDAGISTIRDLDSDLTGKLRWDGDVIVTNTSLTTELATKQDTLIAGSNITITGNTIASTGGSGSSLTLQLDGVTQTATTLNFIQNDALLSGGVLNVSRLNYYDKIPLIYSTQATIKDLKQDVNSNLVWGTDI